MTAKADSVAILFTQRGRIKQFVSPTLVGDVLDREDFNSLEFFAGYLSTHNPYLSVEHVENMCEVSFYSPEEVEQGDFKRVSTRDVLESLDVCTHALGVEKTPFSVVIYVSHEEDVAANEKLLSEFFVPEIMHSVYFNEEAPAISV